MESLNVYLLGKLAGVLESENGKLSFHYTSNYQNSPDSTPISYSMPLRNEPFGDEVATVFFDNLLPPDAVRKRLGKILHLSRHNIFGFLKAIGGDCAGAISLYPVSNGTDNPTEELPRLRELSSDEAIEILTQLPKRLLNIGRENGFRISGTGAQDKLIACVKDKKIFLPLYGEPSTHIIKPPIKEYPDSVFNEFFCMRLADRMGIPAPNCELLYFAHTAYYCISRYDRKTENEKVSRLHQEDFCQLYSVDPEKKYENEGGPTIPICFNLIKKMHIGIAGQLDFIRRIIFNFLIGNGDAHAKNFSVLYRNNRVHLAPVYDLLCTEIYENLSREFAMSIGNEFAFDKVSKANFQEMATACNIRPEIVLAQLDDIVSKITPIAETLAKELQELHPSPVYSAILDIIHTNILQVTDNNRNDI